MSTKNKAPHVWVVEMKWTGKEWTPEANFAANDKPTALSIMETIRKTCAPMTKLRIRKYVRSEP